MRNSTFEDSPIVQHRQTATWWRQVAQCAQQGQHGPACRRDSLYHGLLSGSWFKLPEGWHVPAAGPP